MPHATKTLIYGTCNFPCPWDIVRRSSPIINHLQFPRLMADPSLVKMAFRTMQQHRKVVSSAAVMLTEGRDKVLHGRFEEALLVE